MFREWIMCVVVYSPAEIEPEPRMSIRSSGDDGSFDRVGDEKRIGLLQNSSKIMGILDSTIGKFKGLFAKRVEGSPKNQEKLEKKYGLISGGTERDDGQVKSGWAITKGRRFYNEDNIFCQFLPIPDGETEGSTSQVACMAVYDGHGGANASIFVRDNLFKNLLRHAHFKSHLFKAVEDAYRETDQQYLEQDAIQHNDDGCTATSAVLVGRRLVVAHVGDSRAVLGEGGVATPLTLDHKPNRPDERSRIENVGGTVVHAGTWRVGGVLAVSRSFGNRQLKQWIVAQPEIREDMLHSLTTSLIVATDGVWDVVTNEEAVEAVSKYDDAEAAAKALATMAYERGSYDNISCVVCLFNFSENDDGGIAQLSKSQSGKIVEKAALTTADTAFPAQSTKEHAVVVE